MDKDYLEKLNKALNTEAGKIILEGIQKVAPKYTFSENPYTSSYNQGKYAIYIYLDTVKNYDKKEYDEVVIKKTEEFFN